VSERRTQRCLGVIGLSRFCPVLSRTETRERESPPSTTTANSPPAPAADDSPRHRPFCIRDKHCDKAATTSPIPRHPIAPSPTTAHDDHLTLTRAFTSALRWHNASRAPVAVFVVPPGLTASPAGHVPQLPPRTRAHGSARFQPLLLAAGRRLPAARHGEAADIHGARTRHEVTGSC
jgi:hypothetical protein